MVLSSEERCTLKQTWDKLAGVHDEIGEEALHRLFLVYPTTKTYFPHFDLSSNSTQVRNHGKKVIKAVEDCLKNVDHLHETLGELSNLHAYNLRVDPVNFGLLSLCIQVVLATHLRSEFNSVAFAAWDKFLSCVSEKLVEKYR